MIEATAVKNFAENPAEVEIPPQFGRQPADMLAAVHFSIPQLWTTTEVSLRG